jgi:Spy/CpxP family protein refolding chaperone
MSWIKLAVAGLALCAGASAASAQGAAPAGAPATSGPEGGPQGGQRGGRGIAMLLEGITLTDAQQVKVDAVKEKYAAERKALMPNGMGGGPPDESVRAKMKEMSENQYAELRAILTADQQKVFDANLEKRKQKTKSPAKGS